MERPKRGIPEGGNGARNAYSQQEPKNTKLCNYFMATGKCKFGDNCRFAHPDMGLASAAPLGPSGFSRAPFPAPTLNAPFLGPRQQNLSRSCQHSYPSAPPPPPPPRQQNPPPPRFVSMMASAYPQPQAAYSAPRPFQARSETYLAQDAAPAYQARLRRPEARQQAQLFTLDSQPSQGRSDIDQRVYQAHDAFDLSAEETHRMLQRFGGSVPHQTVEVELPPKSHRRRNKAAASQDHQSQKPQKPHPKKWSVVGYPWPSPKGEGWRIPPQKPGPHNTLPVPAPPPPVSSGQPLHVWPPAPEGTEPVDWDKGLPLDILAQVARSLGGVSGMDNTMYNTALRGMEVMRSVSKTWRAGFELSVVKIRVFTRHVMLPSDLSTGRRFPALTYLDIGGFRLAQLDARAILGALPNLTELRVSGATDTDLRTLEGLTITSLDISYTSKISGATMDSLKSMPLKVLNMHGCSGVDDEGLLELHGMQLTELDMGQMYKVTDEGIQALRGMALRALDLSFCSKITPAALDVLRGMPLRKLAIGNCDHIGAADLTRLQGLPINDLNFQLSSDLTDGGLEHIAGFPLTKLNLSQCSQLTGTGLEYLKGDSLTNLASVSFTMSRSITDAALQNLRGAPLTSLVMSGCCLITDVGLACLKGMPLTNLDLSGCELITDAGMAAVLDAPLVKLELIWCKLVSKELIQGFKDKGVSVKEYPDEIISMGGVEIDCV